MQKYNGQPPPRQNVLLGLCTVRGEELLNGPVTADSRPHGQSWGSQLAPCQASQLAVGRTLPSLGASGRTASTGWRQ